MSPFIENIQVALPELIILVTGVLVLLSGLFIKDKNSYALYALSALGLILAGVCNFLMLGNYKVLAFSGLFISDDMACLAKIFIYFTVLLCLIYSRDYIAERHIQGSDYVVLVLFSTLGMMVLVSAHSLLTVYLGLELLSLPLYAMTAIRRSESDASEAAMKYFVMGALASGMLLFGMSLIYGITGQLGLTEIAHALSDNWQQRSDVIAFALVFIVAGIGFKMAAVPFHMWAPDVYQGAPGSVTLFLSAAPKIAAVAMAFRLLTIGLVDVSVQWQHLVLVLALLSTGLGNLLAISQTNIRRMLAYSAISHMGYALFGILAATHAGYAAALYYALIYSLMSVAAFGLIILLSNRGMEVEQIADLSGLNKKNPWLALMMLIVMFSMAGVPPTVGFFGKLLVLKALVDVQLTWVAVLGLLFAVIGAFYYLRVVKVMYFDDALTPGPMSISGPRQWIFSINCLVLLYLGIFPGALIAACMGAFSG